MRRVENAVRASDTFIRPSHLVHFSTSSANVRAIRCAHGQYREPFRFGGASDSASTLGADVAARGTIFGLHLLAAASTPA